MSRKIRHELVLDLCPIEKSLLGMGSQEDCSWNGFENSVAARLERGVYAASTFQNQINLKRAEARAPPTPYSFGSGLLRRLADVWLIHLLRDAQMSCA
jgi:hypothetical protein